MDKKIKSVKLKHDYWDEFTYVQQGTELTRAKLNYWYLNETRTINENDIISNKSKIFEIEYEPETETKWITVKIEYEFNDYKLGTEDVQCALADYNTKRMDKLLYFNNLTVTEIK